MAATHVTDQHEVGTDHDGQLLAWMRLPDHAQKDQAIEHDGADASLWPRKQLHGATSMKLESVSVRVLTPDLQHGVRHHETVMAIAVGTDIACAQKSLVVLRFLYVPLRQAP